VLRDGSLVVDENITYSFSGGFSGAFREIALREGESIDEVAVFEGGQRYRPGAAAELGSPGSPGTFGTTQTDKGLRIVWHYQASSEERTFHLHYRLRGLAVAYDDVVDVNLKVWGDQWPVRLGQLTATLTAPAPVDRAWGHPVSVRGDITIEGESIQLRAVDIPARQFVELRALIPRNAFSSTVGMQERSETALERIAGEEREDAAAYERDRKRLDDALADPWQPLIVLLLLAVLPAFAAIALVWWLWGRERGTGYDREYEQEPPTETQPALVPSLLAQGGTPGSLEFTATLFDLIRRGRYKATPVTTERKIWAGLRTQQVADLELSLDDVEAPVETFEAPVASVVDSLLHDGPEQLSRFRDRIEDDRTKNSERFTDFKSAVGTAVRPWFRNDGLKLLIPTLVAFAALGALLLWQGISRIETFAPRWGDVLLIAFGVCAIVNAIVLLAATLNRRLWRRRAPAAQQEAERWEAFRRYLTDFPRLAEAPPATLELWERFLVYGIAFGIAERVLQGAQLHMPEALATASSLYWVGPHGDLGSGPTSLGIGDLASGFGSALAPPSSGSGGFGGGFSGGGGGGGGGGGAW
jgi:uncharacterized membrane protein